MDSKVFYQIKRSKNELKCIYTKSTKELFYRIISLAHCFFHFSDDVNKVLTDQNFGSVSIT